MGGLSLRTQVTLCFRLALPDFWTSTLLASHESSDAAPRPLGVLQHRVQTGLLGRCQTVQTRPAQSVRLVQIFWHALPSSRKVSLTAARLHANSRMRIVLEMPAALAETTGSGIGTVDARTRPSTYIPR